MCGFIVNKSGNCPVTRYVQRRGPDSVGHVRRGQWEFRHYLLHITGVPLRQPLVDDDVICVFNGEIYNHEFHQSDGEVIIPLYRQYGEHFARQLDGEYAIAIYDFRHNRALFVTDPFGTKPLWVSGAQCASYPSALGGTRVPPNTTLIHSLTGAVVGCLTNYDFDFNNQDKGHFGDWIKAFKGAVRKRGKTGCYIGLSSGYDSGAIGCELYRQGMQFGAYSIRGSEDLNVVRERQRLIGGCLLEVAEDDITREKEFLYTHCERYDYRDAGLITFWSEMLDDPGAVGASMIHRAATKDGRRVYLSGQGADEVLSDYALTPEVSHFNGVFPVRLKRWPNLFDRCQRAYLTKEEFVAGCHGVEGRYPFLDSSVVQEFLWLTPELKNSAYKAPLKYYFESEGFPFDEGKKAGFMVLGNVDEQLRALTGKLSLTIAQQRDVKPVLQHLHNSIDGLIQDKGLSSDKRLARIRSQRYTARESIREVLTNEQNKNLDQYLQRLHREMHDELGAQDLLKSRGVEPS